MHQAKTREVELEDRQLCGYGLPRPFSSKHVGQMLCVMRCRRPVTNVCNTTSRSSHMPSTARLPHQAHSVTLSAKSCRDGARGLGTPAAASETRAGSLMIEGDFRSLFRDRQAGEGRRFRALACTRRNTAEPSSRSGGPEVPSSNLGAPMRKGPADRAFLLHRGWEVPTRYAISAKRMLNTNVPSPPNRQNCTYACPCSSSPKPYSS